MKNKMLQRMKEYGEINGDVIQFTNFMSDSELKGLKVKNSSIVFCNFSYANLKDSKFNRVCFQHCEFSAANLEYVEFTECHFISCSFLSKTAEEVLFHDCRFDRCSMEISSPNVVIQESYIDESYFIVAGNERACVNNFALSSVFNLVEWEP